MAKWGEGDPRWIGKIIVFCKLLYSTLSRSRVSGMWQVLVRHVTFYVFDGFMVFK